MEEAKRKINIESLTTEVSILKSYIEREEILNTKIKKVKSKNYFKNQVEEKILGIFTIPEASKSAIADIDHINSFIAKKISIPSFLAAGARKELSFNPMNVRAAIVTPGGLAPGLHCVIHSIVKRHWDIYQLTQNGKIFGIYNGYKGLCDISKNFIELNPDITEKWWDLGGCKLGCKRFYNDNLVETISKSLVNNQINLLYILGGDGSLKKAHEIAKANPEISVVGVPKTMDNDILWVWQSFGFNTAVEQASQVINALHSEAESTRRIGIVELFGAESGFVAANATLTSGHVDLVLIPEIFKSFNSEANCNEYLDSCIKHVQERVIKEELTNKSPHALIVVAEGVGTILEKKKFSILGIKITKENFSTQFKNLMLNRIKDCHNEQVPIFINQPKHYIRSLPANTHDRIYCERLGALAVDNALAGYTDFMISQWLNNYVLVPLELVVMGRKSIPLQGMFWKQISCCTKQPSHE